MDIKIVNTAPDKDIKEILSLYHNNFNNLEKIGCGYSAVVFRYKSYAIKAYEDSDFNDGEILENFQDNELFPKLYFYNKYFMVTEYLEIASAYKYFERNVNIELDAFDIFEYCYKKGFIICDIHEENVVVTKDDKLKIIDVGNFRRHYNGNNYSLDNILNNNIIKNEYIELNNIINYVKRPPIAI